MKKKLSIAIATFNEEKNIDRCLSSVANFADEIILVDGGSTDGTVVRAKQYTVHITETDNPPIFHINKQKAVDKCSGEWILQLDADEEVSIELKKEITEIITSENAKEGYYIPRHNYFGGKLMKKGGTYPDYVIRLFKRGKGKFPCRSVHEQIEIEGETDYIKSPLNHYPYDSFKEYLRKANTYTTLTAEELKKKRVPVSPESRFIYTVYKPVSTFVNLYIRHGAFLDGRWGFIWALFSGLHYAVAFNKYTKNKSSK